MARSKAPENHAGTRKRTTPERPRNNDPGPLGRFPEEDRHPARGPAPAPPAAILMHMVPQKDPSGREIAVLANPPHPELVTDLERLEHHVHEAVEAVRQGRGGDRLVTGDGRTLGLTYLDVARQLQDLHGRCRYLDDVRNNHRAAEVQRVYANCLYAYRRCRQEMRRRRRGNGDEGRSVAGNLIEVLAIYYPDTPYIRRRRREGLEGVLIRAGRAGHLPAHLAANALTEAIMADVYGIDVGEDTISEGAKRKTGKDQEPDQQLVADMDLAAAGRWSEGSPVEQWLKQQRPIEPTGPASEVEGPRAALARIKPYPGLTARSHS